MQTRTGLIVLGVILLSISFVGALNFFATQVFHLTGQATLLLADTPPCGLNYTDISATSSGPSASVSSLPASQAYDFAVMFQSGSNITVGGVSLYLRKLQAASGTFDVTIKSNSGGVPGSVLVLILAMKRGSTEA